jgi:hypothetical protein
MLPHSNPVVTCDPHIQDARIRKARRLPPTGMNCCNSCCRVMPGMNMQGVRIFVLP